MIEFLIRTRINRQGSKGKREQCWELCNFYTFQNIKALEDKQKSQQTGISQIKQLMTKNLNFIKVFIHQKNLNNDFLQIVQIDVIAIQFKKMHFQLVQIEICKKQCISQIMIYFEQYLQFLNMISKNINCQTQHVICINNYLPSNSSTHLINKESKRRDQSQSTWFLNDYKVSKDEFYLTE
ncbi:unnamed protein product [Paramecium octaurelia]|uniref:Uncharacterized protein n=1 Tax=Paramecium octaurelia TaxID=43137 RepID=A0A8S1RTE3_PAROT|nr:unnamed protein product [Paramecium octaurelia]CAD8132221.1 unnamed protein product [Paramecium octaurelia]